MAAADLVIEGDVPRRPPGAAVHREPGDDRRPARGRRRHRPRARCSARTTCTRRSSAALGLDDERRVVVQAETGGGFGGKEEFPSRHRAPRRAARPQGRQAGPDDLRPARGHRGDDQAPPGDRPAPHRRDRRRHAHRPGHRGRHGRRRVLHAHAGRAEPRRAPRRRSVPLPERADHRHARPGRTRRRTAPSADSGRRRPSSRPRSSSTASPRQLGDLAARHPAAQRLSRRATSTPTGQVLRDSVGRRGGPRARGRGGRVHEACGLARTEARKRRAGRSCPARRCGRGANGRRRASASRWPGTAPGSPARARSSSRRSSRLELTADGRIRDPDRIDRDGPGHQDDLPADRRRGPGRPGRRGRARAPGHGARPRQRPDRRVADRDGRRGPAHQCRASVARAGRGPRPADRSPTPYVDYARDHGATRIDERFEPYPGGTPFDDATYPVTRTPPSAGRRAWRGSTSTSTPARSTFATVVAADDIGTGHPPGPRRGPGRGRHAAGRRLRHDRGDQAA